MWAVYERLDGGGLVVWRLRKCRDGSYFPRLTRDMPPLAALPLSVHAKRRRARRAAALLLYSCVGSA